MNDDSSDAIKAKLTSEICIVLTKDLIAHAQKGNLIYVDPKCDMIEVGCALAADHVEKVNSWLSSQSIRKINEEQLSAIELDEGSTFQMIIVSPFVIFTKVWMN